MLPNGVIETITGGSMMLAIPIALFAGLVSFLSPCVLPLVPGYLSFMTGVAGANAQSNAAPTRGRTLAGTALFVAGFSFVFISYGALFGGAGLYLLRYQREVQLVLGAIVIVLGLGFLGLIPAMQRELRFHRLPTGTLLGALLLGVVFGVGWSPCIGPTLGAVQGLALAEASAVRGAVLSAFYCLGLGLPFLIIGQLMDKSFKALAILRKHSRNMMKVGGVLLVVIGVLMVTGLWNQVTIALRIWSARWGVLL